MSASDDRLDRLERRLDELSRAVRHLESTAAVDTTGGARPPGIYPPEGEFSRLES